MLSYDQGFPAINQVRKTAIIDKKLDRLNIDIAALSETRLPECGSYKEMNYTFFWQGCPDDDKRINSAKLHTAFH